MSNDYHKYIMDLSGVLFENVEDTDILTFDHFDQGFGVKGFYYLYKADGTLKDIRSGKAIPLTERKFVRPTYKTIKERQALKTEELDKKIEKKNIEKKSMVYNKHGKKTRNLSPEERQKRSERMKIVAQNYWKNKKANTIIME